MVEPKPSGVRPRALPSTVLLCSVLFFLPGVFAGPIIDGVECANVVVVDQYGCNPYSPDYDGEGVVCANDNTPDEAYCSYDVGEYACARCAPPPMIDGVECANVVMVNPVSYTHLTLPTIYSV